ELGLAEETITAGSIHIARRESLREPLEWLGHRALSELLEHTRELIGIQRARAGVECQSIAELAHAAERDCIESRCPKPGEATFDDVQFCLLDHEATPPILRCRSVVSKGPNDLLKCDAVRSDATGELFDGFARRALHDPERDEVQLCSGRGIELELTVDRDFRAS